MPRLSALTLAAGALCAALATAPVAPAQAEGGTPQVAAIPDFSGVWARIFGRRMGAVANLSPRIDVPIGDWKDPILQPWAAAIVKAHGDMERAGIPAPEAKTTCWPGSVPNLMSIPGSVELLQTPQQVTLLHSNDHQVRFIYLDEPHSPHVTPSWFGESVGHYEGDALVVDTIGLAEKPMSTIDVFGTPHTDKLHVVERFYKIDGGKTLRLDISVEDPGTFTKPWTEYGVYKKVDYPFEEYVCAENNPLIGIGSEVGEMPRAKYVSPF
jgi:hypothetical protein